MTKDYPWYTPYQFAGNMPIWAVDLDGLEERIVIQDNYGKVKTVFQLTDYSYQERLQITKSFWGGFSGKEKASGYEWTNGYKNFTYGMGGQDKGWYGPAVGTLTITTGGSKTRLNYDKQKLNWFNTTYVGPNNPVFPDGTYDYSRAPQDLMDAAARAHDKGYDNVEAAGIKGALIDKATIPADVALVRAAYKVIAMYGKGEMDPYTKNPVSDETYQRAQKVGSAFKIIVMNKLNKNNTDGAQEVMQQMNGGSKMPVDEISRPVINKK